LNSLNGTLPTTLGRLSALSYLCEFHFTDSRLRDLAFNKFSGLVPVEMSQMTSLTYLSEISPSSPNSSLFRTLGNTSLSGSLPSQLFLLSRLASLCACCVFLSFSGTHQQRPSLAPCPPPSAMPLPSAICASFLSPVSLPHPSQKFQI
jgi:hypothetical protein